MTVHDIIKLVLLEQTINIPVFRIWLVAAVYEAAVASTTMIKR